MANRADNYMSNKIPEILSAPWAILPAKLEEIQSVYTSHLMGQRKDIKAIEAAIGKSVDASAAKPSRPYEVIDGVAVIPIYGTIAKRMNLFSAISGGVSTELTAKHIKQALSDTDVSAILLDVDSPGGTVDGVEALSNTIYEGRAQKTIIAFANGIMASAAYWIASAAHAIVAEETSEIGSIGVITIHYDYSERDRAEGVKRTVLSTGIYKALGNDAEPLTQDARIYIESMLDAYYTLFVDTVARNRGVDSSTVLTDMAEGKIFIGRQALNAGLIDTIGSIESALAYARDPLTLQKEGGTIMSMKKTDDSPLTLAALKESYPDVHAEAFAEGAASIDQDALRAEGRVEGEAQASEAGQTEKSRIIGLVKVFMGDEAPRLIAAIEGGFTPEAVTALGVKPITSADAEATAKMQALATIIAAGAGNPGSDSTLSATINPDLPLEERTKLAWDRTPTIRSEFGTYEHYLAFEKASASGRVKILSRKEGGN